MRLRLAFVVTAAFAPAAHAGFFTTDAPAPVPVNMMMPTAPTVPSEDAATFKVPFASHSSQIAPAARRALGAILASAQDSARVKISGCGDARDSDSIAYRRASAVKGWLIDNGMSSDAVSVDTDTDSSTLRSGRLFNCAITLTAPPSIARVRSSVLPMSGAPAPLVAASYAAAPKSALGTASLSLDDQTLALIRRVLDMASHRVIKDDDALAMLQEIVKTSPPSTLQPDSYSGTTSTPAYAPRLPEVQNQPRMQYISANVPSIAPAAQTPPNISITPIAQAWTFNKSQNLRETLNDWARSAGWKEPVWKASVPYRISGEPISGDFMNALRTVSAAVPALDMKADPTTRELVISDAGQ